MAKETTGINQRMERIEHLLQGGLRQYMDRIRQPEPINHSREMVNYGTSNIEELILNVRLENTPNLNQWQWCQCMEGAEKA
ncbi:Hypothetical predicted protein [Paramuricea clavata]|uniref:Uncharacterized protein n=1 Tax=Paramuricea clavata TaxID=317549 RepID=A0A7D9EEB9_PARCT|nr:Hypothetical predicted protein [Paramuricea clavata]